MTLIGPKRAHKQQIHIAPRIFLSKKPRIHQPNERLSEPKHPGEGRGRENPPPGACLEALRFGGFVTRSATLHAERPEASADFIGDKVTSKPPMPRNQGHGRIDSMAETPAVSLKAFLCIGGGVGIMHTTACDAWNRA